MRIEVEEDYTIKLKEVYNSILLETNSGEMFSICMRDSGFEFYYDGKRYEAKEGNVLKFSK